MALSDPLALAAFVELFKRVRSRRVEKTVVQFGVTDLCRNERLCNKTRNSFVDVRGAEFFICDYFARRVQSEDPIEDGQPA